MGEVRVKLPEFGEDVYASATGGNWYSISFSVEGIDDERLEEDDPEEYELLVSLAWERLTRAVIVRDAKMRVARPRRVVVSRRTRPHARRRRVTVGTRRSSSRGDPDDDPEPGGAGPDDPPVVGAVA